MNTRPSVVFLDRDGTIIRDVHYLADADQVALLDGAAEAIRRLNVAGIPVVVVTNQSGIARGYFTVTDYKSSRRRLDELLAARGAHIDASYFCPHIGSISGECDCRKPATRLFRDAAHQHRLDMSAPAFVGDRWRDVAPFRDLGGLPVLIRSDATPTEDMTAAQQQGVAVVASLQAAVERLLGGQHTNRARIAVLASGGGSNLQAILDHFSALGDARSGEVVLVGSNRPGAGALTRARRANVAAEQFQAADGGALIEILDRHEVNIVALAGYLKLIPNNVIQRFRDRIVNVHPGPLPHFGGEGMYGIRVHEAVIASGIAKSAATVHMVDEQYDHGAILAQWPVPVQRGDTPTRLAARVLAAEHIIYPRIIDALAENIARAGVTQTDPSSHANSTSLGL